MRSLFRILLSSDHTLFPVHPADSFSGFPERYLRPDTEEERYLPEGQYIFWLSFFPESEVLFPLHSHLLHLSPHLLRQCLLHPGSELLQTCFLSQTLPGLPLLLAPLLRIFLPDIPVFPWPSVLPAAPASLDFPDLSQKDSPLE